LECGLKLAKYLGISQDDVVQGPATNQCAASAHEHSDAVRLKDLLLITSSAAIPALVLRAFPNTPFVDDWTYAWSVENLLRMGKLQVLDWSTNPNFSQILWGGLFCLPFGFSFTALRVSTWVLSILGLWGFYCLLRAVAITRRDSLIATALLAVCPVYFILSYSFMTDIPWLTAAIWFAYSLVRAVRTRHTGWLFAATAFACVAISIRLTAAILPLVMIAVLLLHSARWGHSRFRLLLPVIPLAVLAAVLYWNAAHTVHRADLTWIQGSPQTRTRNLKYGFFLLYKRAPDGLLCMAAILGILLLPVAIGSFRKAYLRRTAVICGCLVLLAGVRVLGHEQLYPEQLYPVLKPGNMWSAVELGATEELQPNPHPPEMPPWSYLLLNAIAYPSFSIALAAVLRQPRDTGLAAIQ